MKAIYNKLVPPVRNMIQIAIKNKFYGMNGQSVAVTIHS